MTALVSLNSAPTSPFNPKQGCRKAALREAFTAQLTPLTPRGTVNASLLLAKASD